MTADEVSLWTNRAYPPGTSIGGTECLFVNATDATTVTIAYSGRSIDQVKALFPLGKDETSAPVVPPAWLTNGIPELYVQIAEPAPTGTPTVGTIVTLDVSLGGYPAGPIDQFEHPLLGIAELALGRLFRQ